MNKVLENIKRLRKIGNWNYSKYLAVPHSYQQQNWVNPDTGENYVAGGTDSFDTRQTAAQGQVEFSLSDFISGLQSGNYGSKADGYKNLRDTVYKKAKLLSYQIMMVYVLLHRLGLPNLTLLVLF